MLVFWPICVCVPFIEYICLSIYLVREWSPKRTELTNDESNEMNETTTIQEIEELQLEEEELLEVSIINEGFNDDDDDIYEEGGGGGETVDESLAPLKEEVANIEEGGNVNQLVSEIHEIEEEIEGERKTWTDGMVSFVRLHVVCMVCCCPTQFLY